MKQEILFYFRKSVEMAASQYLEQFKDKPEFSTISLVIKGFLRYLFDETAY